MRAIAFVIAAAGCGRIGFDAALGLTPDAARINTGSKLVLVASGGTPPYAFATDLGSIDSIDSGGLLHASSTAGTATVTVIDAAGDSAGATVEIGGDFIYIAGGYDSAIRDEVYRTADGIDWTLVGRLPAARTYGSLVVYDDQLYYLGGWIDMPDGIPADNVWRSPDGATWTAIGTLPQPAAAQSATVWNGRIWLGDGRVSADAYTPTLWSSSDGVTWGDEPPLPVAGHNIALVPVRDELWTVAGHHELAQSAELHASSDGATWTSPGMVPAAGEYRATCVYADRLWVAGGIGLTKRVVSTADGVTWLDATPLALDRQYATLLAFQDELWLVGGAPADTVHSPDGMTWTVLPPYPLLVQGANAVQLTPR